MSDVDLSGLPPAQPDESGDLADHEAAFGPDGTGDVPDPVETTPEPTPVAQTAAEQKAERDEQGRFQKTPRHRARSQTASPADVPRIQELTAKLRAAEAERDALKARPMPSPPPVREDRPLAPAPVAEREPSRPAVSPAPPTRPKPSEDEVGTKYAVYAELVEDLNDWKDEQREARVAAQKQLQTYQEWGTAYQAKVADLRAKVPDYDTAIQTANQQTHGAGLVVPQVLLDAIISSDRGPEVEYWLAKNLADYHALIRDAWSVNQFSSIGMVRRVLESKLPALPAVASSQRSPREAAGVTGAAPTLTVVPAPRPPTPVRTGSLKNGDEPPDDDQGLDAHEAHYYRRSR